MVEQWPEGNRRRDAVFRRALTQSEAGEHSAGLRTLKSLKRVKRYTRNDQLKIALVRGVMLLKSGKTRKGLKTLVRTLEDASSLEVVWYQAWARTALVEELLETSSHLEFDGPEKTWAATLERRSQVIVAAEAQLSKTVDLADANSIIAQLRMLGDAYVDFGADLQLSPAPTYLSEEEQTEYSRQLAGYVETTWVKASRYYELGIDHAARVGWLGPEPELLEARFAEINARLEGL